MRRTLWFLALATALSVIAARRRDLFALPLFEYAWQALGALVLAAAWARGRGWLARRSQDAGSASERAGVVPLVVAALFMLLAPVLTPRELLPVDFAARAQSPKALARADDRRVLVRARVRQARLRDGHMRAVLEDADLSGADRGDPDAAVNAEAPFRSALLLPDRVVVAIGRWEASPRRVVIERVLDAGAPVP